VPTLELQIVKNVKLDRYINELIIFINILLYYNLSLETLFVEIFSLKYEMRNTRNSTGSSGSMWATSTNPSFRTGTTKSIR